MFPSKLPALYLFAHQRINSWHTQETLSVSQIGQHLENPVPHLPKWHLVVVSVLGTCVTSVLPTTALQRVLWRTGNPGTATNVDIDKNEHKLLKEAKAFPNDTMTAHQRNKNAFSAHRMLCYQQ
ncbi:hypothetical protein Tcan_10975 [Toxocara canis]|uniref:Uncharacterized protein n=2 Tax=Toxocara canis TaxID=6265 RepID=A0A0B2V4P3_TOXCA|nr:hypothetical protein Tcan_10975 [Toxocara canis]VDM24311.1 unnamed protein product [Toxocara canis]